MLEREKNIGYNENKINYSHSICEKIPAPEKTPHKHPVTF